MSAKKDFTRKQTTLLVLDDLGEWKKKPHAFLVCTMSRTGKLKFYESDFKNRSCIENK
jgi:hypothetical protein